MKKQMIIMIGMVILLLSYLSEIAFSAMEKERWSNYTQCWELKWTIDHAITLKDNLVKIQPVTGWHKSFLNLP